MFVQTDERVQMKKLMFVAVVAMLGASAYAASQPRVYQYAASLNTTVAKQGKYSYKCDGDTIADTVAYRVKGNVSLKGVVIEGCYCLDQVNFYDGNYPIFLVASSQDKYVGVTFANTDIWSANRLGAAQPSKAKVAELGFDNWFVVGPTNEFACIRGYSLWHAGFGTAGVIESGEGLDIISVSGNIVGDTTAPYLLPSENDCPRCEKDGDCETAIAFAPCVMDDCEMASWSQNYFSNSSDRLDATDVAYGTFTLKYNKTLSDAIKQDVTDQAAINTLVPKVFGSKAVAPTLANIDDYFAPWAMNP
jgi:hypothetical protein